MRNLKSDCSSLLASDASLRDRLPVIAGDRHELGSIRHLALPRHLHPNYQHWHWLSR